MHTPSPPNPDSRSGDLRRGAALPNARPGNNKEAKPFVRVEVNTNDK